MFVKKCCISYASTIIVMEGIKPNRSIVFNCMSLIQTVRSMAILGFGHLPQGSRSEQLDINFCCVAKSNKRMSQILHVPLDVRIFQSHKVFPEPLHVTTCLFETVGTCWHYQSIWNMTYMFRKGRRLGSERSILEAGRKTLRQEIDKKKKRQSKEIDLGMSQWSLISSICFALFCNISQFLGTLKRYCKFLVDLGSFF